MSLCVCVAPLVSIWPPSRVPYTPVSSPLQYVKLFPHFHLLSLIILLFTLRHIRARTHTYTFTQRASSACLHTFAISALYDSCDAVL